MWAGGAAPLPDREHLVRVVVRLQLMKLALELTAIGLALVCGACRSSKSVRQEPSPSQSAPGVSQSARGAEASPRSGATASGASWLPWPAPDAAELQSGQRETAFSLALARQLPVAEAARAKASSFVFAPVSLAAVLALSYEAARGVTRAEIGKSLGLNGAADTEGARGLARLAEFAAADPRFRAQHATALWTAPSVTLRSAFRDRAAQYGAALLSAKPAESPTAAINVWLKSAMAASGQLLLPADALRADSRFVMADFLSVEGAWRTPFDVERTRSLPFTAGNGKKLDLPTMTSVGTVLAASGPDYDAVELSLQSPEHHLCIVQPKPGKLADLQGSLGVRMAEIRAALRPSYAELQLPKYKIDSSLSLQSALSAVGMVTAFSNQADFGEMSESQVYLDQVLQNVTFEVNERGLRATSATVASFPPPSPPKTPVVIRINRAFLFALLNLRTGAVLFLGRYSGPSL